MSQIQAFSVKKNDTVVPYFPLVRENNKGIWILVICENLVTVVIDESDTCFGNAILDKAKQQKLNWQYVIGGGRYSWDEGFYRGTNLREKRQSHWRITNGLLQDAVDYEYFEFEPIHDSKLFQAVGKIITNHESFIAYTISGTSPLGISSSFVE